MFLLLQYRQLQRHDRCVAVQLVDNLQIISEQEHEVNIFFEAPLEYGCAVLPQTPTLGSDSASTSSTRECDGWRYFIQRLAWRSQDQLEHLGQNFVTMDHGSNPPASGISSQTPHSINGNGQDPASLFTCVLTRQQRYQVCMRSRLT
jgi:hypothetical protein